MGDKANPSRFRAHNNAVVLGNQFKKLIELSQSPVFIGFFPPAELKQNLYFIAFLKEFVNLASPDKEVVSARAEADADLFHIVPCLGLGLLFFLKLFLFLVAELIVVADAGNRRVCRRGYLYQVQSALFGNFQSGVPIEDAEVFTSLADYTMLAGRKLAVFTNGGNGNVSGFVVMSSAYTKEYSGLRGGSQLKRLIGNLRGNPSERLYRHGVKRKSSPRESFLL